MSFADIFNKVSFHIISLLSFSLALTSCFSRVKPVDRLGDVMEMLVHRHFRVTSSSFCWQQLYIGSLISIAEFSLRVPFTGKMTVVCFADQSIGTKFLARTEFIKIDRYYVQATGSI